MLSYEEIFGNRYEKAVQDFKACNNIIKEIQNDDVREKIESIVLKNGIMDSKSYNFFNLSTEQLKTLEIAYKGSNPQATIDDETLFENAVKPWYKGFGNLFGWKESKAIKELGIEKLMIYTEKMFNKRTQISNQQKNPMDINYMNQSEVIRNIENNIENIDKYILESNYNNVFLAILGNDFKLFKHGDTADHALEEFDLNYINARYKDLEKYKNAILYIKKISDTNKNLNLLGDTTYPIMNRWREVDYNSSAISEINKVLGIKDAPEKGTNSSNSPGKNKPDMEKYNEKYEEVNNCIDNIEEIYTRFYNKFLRLFENYEISILIFYANKFIRSRKTKSHLENFADVESKLVPKLRSILKSEKQAGKDLEDVKKAVFNTYDALDLTIDYLRVFGISYLYRVRGVKETYHSHTDSGKAANFDFEAKYNEFEKIKPQDNSRIPGISKISDPVLQMFAALYSAHSPSSNEYIQESEKALKLFEDYDIKTYYRECKNELSSVPRKYQDIVYEYAGVYYDKKEHFCNGFSIYEIPKAIDELKGNFDSDIILGRSNQLSSVATFIDSLKAYKRSVDILAYAVKFLSRMGLNCYPTHTKPPFFETHYSAFVIKAATGEKPMDPSSVKAESMPEQMFLAIYKEILDSGDYESLKKVSKALQLFPENQDKNSKDINKCKELMKKFKDSNLKSDYTAIMSNIQSLPYKLRDIITSNAESYHNELHILDGYFDNILNNLDSLDDEIVRIVMYVTSHQSDSYSIGELSDRIDKYTKLNDFMNSALTFLEKIGMPCKRVNRKDLNTDINKICDKLKKNERMYSIGNDKALPTRKPEEVMFLQLYHYIAKSDKYKDLFEKNKLLKTLKRIGADPLKEITEIESKVEAEIKSENESKVGSEDKSKNESGGKSLEDLDEETESKIKEALKSETKDETKASDIFKKPSLNEKVSKELNNKKNSRISGEKDNDIKAFYEELLTFHYHPKKGTNGLTIDSKQKIIKCLRTRILSNRSKSSIFSKSNAQAKLIIKYLEDVSSLSKKGHEIFRFNAGVIGEKELLIEMETKAKSVKVKLRKYLQKAYPLDKEDSSRKLISKSKSVCKELKRYLKSCKTTVKKEVLGYQFIPEYLVLLEKVSKSNSKATILDKNLSTLAKKYEGYRVGKGIPIFADEGLNQVLRAIIADSSFSLIWGIYGYVYCLLDKKCNLDKKFIELKFLKDIIDK